MARPFDSRYFQFLCLTLLCLPVMYAADRITDSTFYFKDFGLDSPGFESRLALYGHAKFGNGTASIQIASAGRVVCRTPVKVFDGSPKRMLSFSTSFSFSIPSGLAFFMVPVGFPVDVFDDAGSFGFLGSEMNRTVLVQFDTFMNVKHGSGLNSNHVRIDLNGSASVKSANLSSLYLKLNEGKKLQAWIDYQAGSKRIEVRLGRLGDIKPIHPLLSYRIDLSQVWKEGEMLVGISSSSNTNTSNVYSWRFRIRHIPHWMHSEPIDPNTLPEKTKSITPIPAPPKQKECLFRIMSALLFGTACGAAGASFALFLSTVMRNRLQPVAPAPEGFITKPKVSDQELEYKKLNIVAVVDQQAIKDGKM